MSAAWGNGTNRLGSPIAVNSATVSDLAQTAPYIDQLETDLAVLEDYGAPIGDTLVVERVEKVMENAVQVATSQHVARSCTNAASSSANSLMRLCGSFGNVMLKTTTEREPNQRMSGNFLISNKPITRNTTIVAMPTR